MREESASPSGLSDRRAGDDLNGQVEVADHPANDGQLLRVLLAEVGRAGPDEVEQPRHYCGHAAEMARSRRALQSLAERTGVFRLPEAGDRFHLLHARDEDEVDADLLGDAEIPLLVARVGGEVLRVLELERVHEDRSDHEPPFLARATHQRDVAIVERPHRRNEPERKAPLAREVAGFPDAGRGPGHLHRASTSSTRARSSAESRPERAPISSATSVNAMYAGIACGAAVASACRCRATVP